MVGQDGADGSPLPSDEPDGGASESVLSVNPVLAGDERPSIVPAIYRLEQATTRLNDLADAIGDLWRNSEEHPFQVLARRDDVAAGVLGDLKYQWKFGPAERDLQHRFRLLTGEVLYHLRTALDYATYHLIWADAGAPFNASQFPMEWQEKRWESTCQRWLRGLTDAHLDAYRRLQPFAGCAWSRRLASMSNADKHRTTLRLGIAQGAAMGTGPTEVFDDPADPEWMRVLTTPRVHVYDDKGAPLYTTLRGLLEHVSSTVRVIGLDLDGGDLGLTLTAGGEFPSGLDA